MGKLIIFLYSYHHKNTQKIADAIAAKINASIMEIKNNSDVVELETYDLVGFGAGIDSGKHYPQLLEYVEKLPNVQHKKAFIFSTSAIYHEKIMLHNHKALNNLLKNKDRPNDEDIKNAEIFAETLLH
jgi:flavodoxin